VQLRADAAGNFDDIELSVHPNIAVAVERLVG
jgi:hypothetical protein